MGTSFASIASSGPLLLAVGVAVLAGLVSFLSPCVLPLVPGYVSYVTGMAGADLDAALGTDPLGRPVPRSGGGAAVRGRIVTGTLLFVAGFTVVFTLAGLGVARAGRALLVHQRIEEIVVGALIVVLGFAFLGLIPGLQRDLRLRRLPAAGLAGAPVLGAVFGLSWTPCLGPTLVAVLGLAETGGQAGRAVTLTVAYCLGLGIPFLAFGLGLRRLLGVFAAVRRHSRWVTRFGGVLLVLVGIALLTGGWAEFVIWLRAVAGNIGAVNV
jgi:cytochrome c-type biogenesis protein